MLEKSSTANFAGRDADPSCAVAHSTAISTAARTAPIFQVFSGQKFP